MKHSQVESSGAVSNAYRALAIVMRLLFIRSRWQLAGDQLLVDLDLSADNLPAGTMLEIGSTVIQVTAQPHTGCQKFVERFGVDALKFVSTVVGKQMRLRGMNGKVARGG